ncbi:hypothetical protein ANN_01126 [Periplaneta americana]|uniref:Uncharacterized protein n=1 Tax=Periplaneta americana TaxID=6978 RepID=A0ABQ8TUG8_PERAM|nr:hypothetical protein ANN_01126 [Periplaneta americana]
MAGLCEGGNEPTGSLKAISKYSCNIFMITTFPTSVQSKPTHTVILIVVFSLLQRRGNTVRYPLPRLEFDDTGVKHKQITLLGYISVADVPEFCPARVLLRASKSTGMSLSHLRTLNAIDLSRDRIRNLEHRRSALYRLRYRGRLYIYIYVYGPNVMSKQMVRCYCRQFSAGRQNVHDEERSRRPTIITDDLVEQRTNNQFT